MSDGPIEQAWQAYHEARGCGQPDHIARLRNQILNYYLPLVARCARAVSIRVPKGVELDDLVHEGVFGLMKAIDSYDPERQVKFSTYAPRRITGAILDYLRLLDSAPRPVRARRNLLDRASATFKAERGFAPTEQELGDWLGLGRDELARLLKDGRNIAMTSLEQIAPRRRDRTAAPADVIEDPHAPDPATAAQKFFLKQLVTEGLEKDERLVVLLYYYEQLTMKEIGQALGISESRVSQMHKSIIGRLKARLGDRRRELAAALAP